MFNRRLCHAALAATLAACGGEEMFQLELGSTERPVGAVTVAQIAGGDRVLDQPVVVGDIDGDGIPDAVVAGVAYIPNDVVVTDVYVIYGGSAVTGSIALASLPHLSGLGVPAQIMALGDVDGDGLADFLVSSAAEGNHTPSPRGGYLVYGRATRLTGTTPISDAGVLFRGATSLEFEDSFASLGDLDGDGLGDFAIAESDGTGNPWTVFVFYGSAARRTGPVDPATGADAVISVPSDSGCDLASTGDVDGDGRPDFMIRAMHRDDRGFFTSDLHLVRGQTARLAGPVALGDITATQFVVSDQSTALALGDLDGDGVADFALRGESTYRLFYGRSGGFPPTVASSSADATIGNGTFSLAAIARGDAGRLDLVAGDPFLHGREGAVHLVHVATGRLAGSVDLSQTETYVGTPRRADNCDFATSSNCMIQEGLGDASASGAITGGDRPNLLVTDTASGITPEGVRGSSFVRMYVLALPDRP